MEGFGQILKYPQEAYNTIGAAMKVHAVMGPGFTEKVYQDALAIELEDRSIPFSREVQLRAVYKGIVLGSTFIPDFICYDKIIVEIKAVQELNDVHRSQAMNYARVANMQLALLLNFGESSLVHERFVF